VRFATSSVEREFLVGDLEEGFDRQVSTRGVRAARRWYWRQAVGALWHSRGRTGHVVAIGSPGTRTGKREHMRNLLRDVRFGVRALWHSPVYSLVAIATLALAIGANTLLFSIANPLVIRPLPIKDAGTLGWILLNNAANDSVRSAASVPEFLEWRAQSKTLTNLAARELHGATVTGHSDPQHVQVTGVTANLCDLWGLHPSLGRLFETGEDAPGHPMVVVLSHHYWQNTYQGSRDVLGQTIFVDNTPATIVGVMEPEIETYGYSTIDLWAPTVLDPAASRSARTLRVVGRLAPGATLESATAEIRSFVASEQKLHPDVEASWTPGVVSTHTAISGPDTWVLLSLLAVVVGFVLLIACANLANLVLARIVRRRHDFAVRQGLGASRFDLMRPLLVESLILSLVGGVLALGVAKGGLRLIRANAFDQLLQRLDIDGNVLIFTAALSVITPLLFSLWPAMGLGRSGVADVLRSSRVAAGRDTRRRRDILVGVQVALALSLLVVSGLVLRTVINFQRVNPGFDLQHVLTFQIEPPASRYADDAARARFTADMVRSLEALPRVMAAAAISHLPVFDNDVLVRFTGTLHDGQRESDRPWASSYAATPDCFRALDMPLVAGRFFATSDTASSQPVAIVSRMAAEKYFDSVSNALGRSIQLTGKSDAARPAVIVGVVGDTNSSQVTTTVPQIYFPLDQRTPATMTVLLRATGPADRAADARVAIRQLDPNLAISLPKTMATLVHESTADNWIVSGLFGGFAVLALVLAAGGLYGVIAYSVGARQREIGVRLALGASPRTVGRMIFVESLKVTGIGVLCGLVLAWLLAHAAASVLFGVSPNDPATFGLVTLTVFVVALSAVWGPAARAMRVDPANTLRAE
jgi:predicted permease